MRLVRIAGYLSVLLPVLVAALALVVPGAPESWVHAQENEVMDSLTHDGYERTFIVHVPPDYDGSKPAPLVIMLHGATMNGTSMMLISDFNTTADAMGALVVYPDGLAGRWGYLDADQLPPNSAYRDDVGFVGALIDYLSEEYAVDASRVYVAGYSNGGMLALRLRCELEDRLAGVAAIGASLSFDLALHCLLSDPVPVMVVLGTADGAFPMLGYAVPTNDGGLDAMFSLNQTMTFFRALNGCDNNMNSADITPPSGQTRVNYYTYNQCVQDTEVTLLSLVDWNHDWPGYEATTLTGPAGDGLVRDAIWAFFDAHALGE